MSCIHYKFRNNSKHDTIQFDGSYITVGEIKQAILNQTKMGKAPDFALQIINAQTQEAYEDDNQLIPRNADVTVKRIPTGTKVSKSKLAANSTSIDMYKMSSSLLPLTVNTMGNDLSKVEGTEDEKLKAMMMQQAMTYDLNTMNNRRSSRRPDPDEEEIPLNYICHRCSKPGHLIKNCPTNGNSLYDREIGRRPPAKRINLNLKKSEKVPEMSAEEKKRMAQNQKNTQDKVRSLAAATFTNIPAEMKCPLCKQLMEEACLSPCCGQSFCDECIREYVLEEGVCPVCSEEVLPASLICNKALRTTISKYKKEHQDQVARLVSDCHIQPKSRDSTPKPPENRIIDSPKAKEEPVAPAKLPETRITTAPAVAVLPQTFFPPPVVSLPMMGIPGAMPAIPPILEKPPPPVAILPAPDEKAQENKVVAPPATILPQIPNYSVPTSVLPLPLPPMLSAAGLLPPPQPLPEQPPVAVAPPQQPTKDDRILDRDEFYAIQQELRRLQNRRSSPPPRRPRHSPGLKISPPSRHRGHHRRPAHPRRRSPGHPHRRSGPRVERRVRGDRPSERLHERPSEGSLSPSPDNRHRYSEQNHRRSSEPKYAEHGSGEEREVRSASRERPRKVHKKKKRRKSDEAPRKVSEPRKMIDEERVGRSPRNIAEPRVASPSPDRPPTPPTSSPPRPGNTPEKSPRVLTPAGTPTAKGGVTPQYTNGLREDEVSLDLNQSDREVNGSESESDTGSKMEELKKKVKEASLKLKLKEQRKAEKKKKKKKKSSKGNTSDSEVKKDKKKKKKHKNEKKKKEHKKKKKDEDEEEELEEGEISVSKKRKRSDSNAEESMSEPKKKKKKKHKHSKEEKEKDESKDEVKIKMNFTRIKEMDSKMGREDRRVKVEVSPLKKKTQKKKRAKHRMTRQAVSAIEDDIQ